MSDFERTAAPVDEPAKRRSPGNWFADLGDRLARGFSNTDRPGVEPPEWGSYDEPEQSTVAVDAPPEWEEPEPPAEPARKRFATALHGYDRDAVDQHLAELEHEVDQLRMYSGPAPAVAAEIERVGEETSAILRVAHEQAAEITRRAQAQADRCVADAAANAVAMTEDAKRQLRRLDAETDSVWAERARLIDDARNVATALFTLAEEATERFPAETERLGTPGARPQPVPVAQPARSSSALTPPPAAPTPPPSAVTPPPAPAPAPPPSPPVPGSGTSTPQTGADQVH